MSSLSQIHHFLFIKDFNTQHSPQNMLFLKRGCAHPVINVYHSKEQSKQKSWHQDLNDSRLIVCNVDPFLLSNNHVTTGPMSNTKILVLLLR